MKTDHPQRIECPTSAEAGSVLVICVLLLVVFFGLTAFAVDISRARATQHHLHLATDAAALAAAGAVINGKTDAQVRQEALDILASNESVAHNILVELGRWNNGVFTVGGVTNAIRVSAAKTVTMEFAKIFNFFTLDPPVVSVAIGGTANRANCLIPFALEDNVVNGRHYGDRINIDRSSPGNWGKVDIGSHNYSCSHCFEDAMTTGQCSDSVSIGDLLSPGTGFGGVRDGFDGRMAVNPIVTVPIVDGFGNGNSTSVRVVGFAVVKLIAQSGSGSNWTGEIEFLNSPTGLNATPGFGEPFAKARALVK